MKQNNSTKNTSSKILRDYSKKSKISAFFWDYENVPLRPNKTKRFLDALDTLFANYPFIFKRIYVRKQTIGLRDQRYLRKRGFHRKKHFKWVRTNTPNAVDNTLIRSCLTVIEQHPEVKQIFLVTGDSDFLSLVTKLPNQRIIVICQKRNYSQKLINTVDKAYVVDSLVAMPKLWILY